MTRDDLAPLGESESFPCPSCGGGGIDREAGTATLVRCRSCNGSGYGTPPDHMIGRLIQWAHRELKNEENA